MSALPDFVEERIKRICSRTEISEEEVRKDYSELFQDPFVQKDEQFQTDEERHRYAIAVLWTRFIARPPMREFDIVPIGYSGLRYARSSGQPNCTIYVLVRGDNRIKRVACRGENADLYTRINLFYSYKVKLGEFKKGGDLIADNRSKFETPVRLSLKPQQIMQKIGVKRIKIADAAKFPSAQRKGRGKRKTSFIDRSDWRCIRGIIVRQFTGTRDDETEFGCYTLADSTVNGEPTVSNDGTVIRPGLTCWTHPSHMVYSSEDEIDCYGTINLTKTGDAQMNCYLILPVHIRGGKK